MRMVAQHKVKGNTIIEVLVALAILSFCSALATIIYLNVQKSSLPFFKIKAVELAEYYMMDALNKRDLSEAGFSNEEFTIKRSVDQSTDLSDCVTLRVIVFDVNKKKIHELETVVLKDNR
jgi:prepilin-type N-terminal cleavage/methylation domain-containing protein